MFPISLLLTQFSSSCISSGFHPQPAVHRSINYWLTAFICHPTLMSQKTHSGDNRIIMKKKKISSNKYNMKETMRPAETHREREAAIAKDCYEIKKNTKYFWTRKITTTVQIALELKGKQCWNIFSYTRSVCSTDIITVGSKSLKSHWKYEILFS